MKATATLREDRGRRIPICVSAKGGIQRFIMATSHVITKRERKVAARSEFRLVCRGLSKGEFSALYRAFKTEFGCKTVLRNPFPPEFDAKAVHEIIAHVTGSAVGGYAIKKVVDAAQELFVAFVKYKLMTPSEDGHARRVQLYGPNNEELYQFKEKREKPKKKK
jgi:hypothetical protein